MMPCGLVSGDQHFEIKCPLYLLGRTRKHSGRQNFKGREHSEHLTAVGRIILKLILRKQIGKEWA